MFGFMRPRTKFAGRIGWLDGRRGYPAEQQFVSLPLRGLAPAPSMPQLMANAPQPAAQSVDTHSTPQPAQDTRPTDSAHARTRSALA